MKRLYYVGACKRKTLYNITVLDNSKYGQIQVVQAREGKTSPQGWVFKKGATYTIANKGKVLNTTLFDTSTVKFGLDLSKEINKNLAKEMNFTKLLKYMRKSDISPEQKRVFLIELFGLLIRLMFY